MDVNSRLGNNWLDDTLTRRSWFLRSVISGDRLATSRLKSRCAGFDQHYHCHKLTQLFDVLETAGRRSLISAQQSGEKTSGRIVWRTKTRMRSCALQGPGHVQNSSNAIAISDCCDRSHHDLDKDADRCARLVRDVPGSGLADVAATKIQSCRKRLLRQALEFLSGHRHGVARVALAAG